MMVHQICRAPHLGAQQLLKIKPQWLFMPTVQLTNLTLQLSLLVRYKTFVMLSLSLVKSQGSLNFHQNNSDCWTRPLTMYVHQIRKKLKDACRTHWIQHIDSYAVFMELSQNSAADGIPKPIQ